MKGESIARVRRQQAVAERNRNKESAELSGMVQSARNTLEGGTWPAYADYWGQQKMTKQLQEHNFWGRLVRATA